MFEEVRDNLVSIDRVFSEELAMRGRKADLRRGFKPEGSQYRRGDWLGLDAVMKTGIDRKYILIEVAFTAEEQEYRAWYLRGFGYSPDAHHTLGLCFIDEITSIVKPYFEVPSRWSETGEGWGKSHPTFEVESEHEKLAFTIPGGGKYNFRDGKLNIFGSSMNFGIVPRDLHPQREELLTELLAKPQFSDYTLNYE